MVRWYVLQVSTGQETGVRDALQGLGIRAAVPREERAIRNGGGWTTKVYTLLPGYVFLALEYSAENYYRVKAKMVEMMVMMVERHRIPQLNALTINS